MEKSTEIGLDGWHHSRHGLYDYYVNDRRLKAEIYTRYLASEGECRVCVVVNNQYADDKGFTHDNYMTIKLSIDDTDQLIANLARAADCAQAVQNKMNEIGEK